MKHGEPKGRSRSGDVRRVGQLRGMAKGAFRLNDEDKAEVDDPTAVSVEELREAQEQCPVAAILVEEDE